MKRIAVIEDNPDNLLLVEAILGGSYEIISFENGPDALRALPDARVDLVLLDISLPVMDGQEVLKAIRADQRISKVPVIALTAHAMVGDREKFLNQGFNEYFSKPIVNFEKLHSLIKQCLEAHS